MTKLKKTRQFNFSLIGIDRQKIDELYGLIHIPNISQEHTSPLGITRLSDLNPNTTPEIISFFDDVKKSHVCNVSIIDFNSGKDISELNYNCFWCRNPFDTQPLGCPIKYIPNEIIKTYQSAVNKETYTMRESVTEKKKESLENNKNISVNNTKRYQSDGVFCHFCCIKAFIEDNKHIPMYKNSTSLLSKLYADLTGNKLISFDSAPHWRLLREYGGHMSIEEFRKTFTNVEYVYKGILKVKFDPIGSLFEETLKF